MVHLGRAENVYFKFKQAGLEFMDTVEFHLECKLFYAQVRSKNFFFDFFRFSILK